LYKPIDSESYKEGRMPISVLCFSKDRPLQLEAYLDSLFRMSARPLPVSVLYTCGPPFHAAYDKLKSRFLEVDFVRETDFKGQVLAYLQQVETPLLMFGCDDVIFKRPWQPREVSKTFQIRQRLLAFSLRLGREITYSHPADRTMSAPHFLESDPFLVWRWPAGQVDWGYPWELDCTVYTVQFVRSMLMAMHKLDWSHPNRLEGLGADLIHRIGRGFFSRASYPLAEGSIITRFARSALMSVEKFRLDPSIREFEDFDLMASYPLARASVVTINRVQDVTPNRIYGGDLTVDDLLEKWNRGMILDTGRYTDQSYRSIHIGEVHLSHRSSET